MGERRVVSVAAVHERGGVLRALRPPQQAARRVRVRAAGSAGPVRRVPPVRARPVRVVPGLRARRPPATRSVVAQGTPAVPGRLRTRLPARMTSRPDQ